MTKDNRPTVRQILIRLGLTEEQAAVLFPQGVDSAAGFPAGIIRQPDGKTEKQRMLEQEDEGWKRV